LHAHSKLNCLRITVELNYTLITPMNAFKETKKKYSQMNPISKQPQSHG